jgi:hypothetical protein
MTGALPTPSTAKWVKAWGGRRDASGPARPGIGREVGRENYRFCQCRSKLSNLSNQKLEREKNSVPPLADIFLRGSSLP